MVWSLEFGWVFTKLWAWFLLPLFPQLPQLHTLPAIGFMSVLTVPFLPLFLTEREMYKVAHEFFTEEELQLISKGKFNPGTLEEEELKRAIELIAEQEIVEKVKSVRATNFHLIKIFVVGPMLLGISWLYHFAIQHGFVGP